MAEFEETAIDMMGKLKSRHDEELYEI